MEHPCGNPHIAAAIPYCESLHGKDPPPSRHVGRVGVHKNIGVKTAGSVDRVKWRVLVECVDLALLVDRHDPALTRQEGLQVLYSRRDLCLHAVQRGHGHRAKVRADHDHDEGEGHASDSQRGPVT